MLRLGRSGMLSIVLELAFGIVGSVLYLRNVLPILFQSYEGGSEADRRKRDRGWGTNWLLALAGLAAFLVLDLISGAVFLFVAIASGAWMEIVMGHEGAP
jgi:hypothetical protein